MGEGCATIWLSADALRASPAGGGCVVALSVDAPPLMRQMYVAVLVSSHGVIRVSHEMEENVELGWSSGWSPSLDS